MFFVLLGVILINQTISLSDEPSTPRYLTTRHFYIKNLYFYLTTTIYIVLLFRPNFTAT